MINGYQVEYQNIKIELQVVDTATLSDLILLDPYFRRWSVFPFFSTKRIIND